MESAGRAAHLRAGYDDEVDAAVGLFLAFFPGGFAGTSGDARCIDALFDNVFLGEVGASLRKLGSLGFFGVRKADDDQLRGWIVLQTESDVVTHTLAGVVEARSAFLVVTAIAGLGGLWRRWRLLHVHACTGSGTHCPRTT